MATSKSPWRPLLIAAVLLGVLILLLSYVSAARAQRLRGVVIPEHYTLTFAPDR